MRRVICHMVLIVVLLGAIARPLRSATLATDAKLVVAGIAVVSAGVALAITAVVLHEKHKTQSMTGCVSSGPRGMNLANDKDTRVYTLSGNTGVVKPGDRVTIAGRRKGALTYEVQSLVKDFGVCQP